MTSKEALNQYTSHKGRSSRDLWSLLTHSHNQNSPIKARNEAVLNLI